MKSRFRKINYFLASFFVVVVISAICYFTRNFIKHIEEVEVFVSKEVYGRLIDLRDQRRGSYFLEIETKTEKVSINSLPISLEVKRFGIQVGDSVSKLPSSRVLFFYRLEDGVYVRYCELEI
jgi:hypothetical protein